MLNDAIVLASVAILAIAIGKYYHWAAGDRCRLVERLVYRNLERMQGR